MNDSADITKASERLNNALSNLVNSLNPILDRVSRLETAVNEGQQFTEDRARLAQELDETKASLASTEAREGSINALAQETRRALDETIRDVQQLIAEAKDGGA